MIDMTLRNISDGGGAMVISSNSNPTLLNNTFVKNHSNFRGGAVEIYDGSDPDFVNNIFWGNTAPENSQIYISSTNCNVDIRYNNIEDGQAGIGPNGIGTGVYENNLDTDPVFADTLAQNWELVVGSPCIDAGIPNVTGFSLPPQDLLGNVRIWDGGSGQARIDMGPYEYNAPLYLGLNDPVTAKGFITVSVYPNPFSSEIIFEFEVKESALVNLCVFNQLGQAVTVMTDQPLTPGIYMERWNAGELPAGMFVVRLQAGNDISSIIIIKTE